MKVIEELPGMIAEEAQDAMKYAKLAMAHKADHPEIAELFIQLSAEELGHMEKIAAKAAGMIKGMQAAYHDDM